MARLNLCIVAMAACAMTACAQPDWVKEMLAAGAAAEGGAGFAERFGGSAGAAPAPGPEGASPCPPPGFKSVDDFDVAAYISQPWYVLAQQPLVYQPADQAFCTTAEYIALNETDPLEGLRVVNTARQGSTTGPVFTTANQPGASLLATVPDPSVPSQLEVGFDDPSGSNLVGTRGGRGPYWVIATGGEAAEGYEWAIVSAGPPTRPSGTGCAGAIPGVSGLWLFSREAQNPEALAQMMAKLEEMGVDTSELIKVDHEGCQYDQA